MPHTSEGRIDLAIEMSRSVRIKNVKFPPIGGVPLRESDGVGFAGALRDARIRQAFRYVPSGLSPPRTRG